jgi:hypothetical protein
LEQKDILFHSQIVLYETVDTAIEAFYVDECNLIEPGGSLRFSPQLQSINPKKGVHPLKSHTFFAIVHYRRWNSCKLLKSASQPIARMVSGAMPDAVQFARLSFMPLSHFSSAGIVLGQMILDWQRASVLCAWQGCSAAGVTRPTFPRCHREIGAGTLLFRPLVAYQVVRRV